ncbi:MFS transporter [Arthrobacter sp. RT-1]|uniref:MFS transporter n=1 Tax=Arthrobacter sp. RT-1 TaxID=2292263 RepID=UPI00216386A0|nr:MFS transporter [Arthrobacter sp. RT-1]
MAAALLTQTALNLARPITTYKLLTLGADAATVGLVAAAYAVLPLVVVMWLGRLTERIPRLGLMLAAGALVLAVGAAGLAVAPNVGAVAAASAVLGLGHLVFTIGGQSSIARYAPQDQLDAGFGWFTAAFAAGQLAGPLLAGILLQSGWGAVPGESMAGVTASLWLGGALSLLAVPLMIWRGCSDRPSSTHRQSVSSRDQASWGDGEVSSPPSPVQPSVWRILKTPAVPSHMLASVALLAMTDILTAFLPLVGERAGLSPAWVGALLAVRGGASILSRAFLPWLARVLPRKALLLSSLYGTGLALALLPLVLSEPWLAVALLSVGGFCMGLGQPITMTMVSTAVPDHWRGAALAVRLMGNRAGQVAMPLAAGFVAAPLGPAGAIWFSCAVLLVGGLEKTFRR